MSESVMDQIIAELRNSGRTFYPDHGELRAVRLVGHTPKTDHYVYDLVIEFSDGSERLAAKVYRNGKCGQMGARGLAKQETGNLQHVHKVFQRRKLSGVPRPLGEFSELGAVVAEKFSGLPLQSLIMKAALLPGYGDHGLLSTAARQTGEWLRTFHKVTADMPAPFDGAALIDDLETLCKSCRGEGLDDAAIRTILDGTRAVLTRNKKTLPTAAVLNDFSPLNVVVGEKGIGFCDYLKMSVRGPAFNDVAQFLASVEALEKYPFCNRRITSEVQRQFLEAYGANQSEQALLRVLKMRALLGMFAQGRSVKETAVRKKVMWATVMKRFIQQAAQRSLAPAA